MSHCCMGTALQTEERHDSRAALGKSIEAQHLLVTRDLTPIQILCNSHKELKQKVMA